MNAKTYLNERLEDQISWYERKSAFNKKCFHTLQILTVIVSACIPVLILFAGQTLFRIITASCGAIVSIATSVASICKFYENWHEYRKTAESLKHEKYMYMAKQGPYAKGDEYAALVERVEALVSQENTAWHQRLTSKK
ncbi:MAG: DUF4231 domain-containing protein [Gammaproteobacteria bacterium]